MFFKKNLPFWERTLRACIGLLVIVAGFYFAVDPMLKWGAAVGGLIFAGTGVIGFCPMCAMVGRKLS